jgi:gliding motility-associated-like protein
MRCALLSASLIFTVLLCSSSLADNRSPFSPGSESVSVHDTLITTCRDTETCDPNIRVSLCFTPNDDGDHDFFTPVYSEDVPVSIELTVYNRYGQLVHSEKGLSPKWDGKYRDKLCAPGVYSWLITTVYSSKKKKKCNGFVLLVTGTVIQVEIPK